MSIVAVVPVAQMAAANATLAALGFGPDNFSVPCYTGAGATHAALHCWENPAFAAALSGIAGVVVNPAATDPIPDTNALITAQGAVWGAKSLPLPSIGNIVAGDMYVYGPIGDTSLWLVIQSFSRTTFGGDPSQYPALLRRVRNPYTVEPWRQPVDQYDAYKLINAFTGQPDQCTHNGQTWTVSAADGSGNNVWEPGVFGWTYPGYVEPPTATWVDTGLTVVGLAGQLYRLSGIPSGLAINQPLRLGPTLETKFNGYWPTVGTPSDYIQITPYVSVAVGAKLWKWA